MIEKVQTLKISFVISCQVKQDDFAGQDEGQREKPLGSRMVVVKALRELQSATGEELRPLFGRTLLPSVLARTFRGEL